MNKKALIEFVRVSLLKGEAVDDNQKTLHFQRVSQAVNYCYDTIIAQIPLTEKGKAEIEAYYVKHYYSQEVKESSGYRYFGISDAIIPVDGGRGVWYVQPSGGGNALARSRRPKIAMFSNLPVGKVINSTVWRLGNISDNQQVILENIGNSPLTDIRFVDFGVVRAFSSYGELEEVRMPDGRFDLMMEMITAWLGGTYNDKSNNNA